MPYNMNIENLITQIYSLCIFTTFFSSSYYHPNTALQSPASDAVWFGR